MRNKLLRWIPAIFLMGLIFAFSNTPSESLPSFDRADRIVKKSGHALGYGLLALSYLYGLEASKSANKLRSYALAFLMAVLYSATDEFHQSFVPGRHPSGWDILIDACGAAAGLAIWRWRRGKQKSG